MNKVDWTRWSAIAEILSATAILFTLGYLAIQTRYLPIETGQNTDAILADQRQEAVQMELSYIRDSLEYPEMLVGSPAFQVPDVDDDYDEKTKIRRVQSAVILMRMRENSWFQHRSGVLDQATWDTYFNVFIGLLQREPYLGASWDIYSPVLNSDFVEQVNAAREERD
jgi:hypothetical protein